MLEGTVANRLTINLDIAAINGLYNGDISEKDIILARKH